MHRRETIKRKENGVTEVKGKKGKEKKNGRQVLLAVFLLFAQAIFQRSLYLYTTTTSQSVVKHLLHVAVGAVVSPRFSPGRRHLMDLRAARDTTATCSLSPCVPNIVHSRALFFMCGKRRFHCPPPSSHCLWLAVKQKWGRSPAPTAPCSPILYIVASTEGFAGGRTGVHLSHPLLLSLSPFYPVSSHVLFYFCPYHAEQ